MASIRGIVVDLPRDLLWYDGMEELVKFTHSTTYDYHKLPPFREQYINCSRHLSQHPFSSVLSGIEEKDPEKLLDLGLRLGHCLRICSSSHMHLTTLLPDIITAARLTPASPAHSTHGR